jgi:hypothetical protein
MLLKSVSRMKSTSEFSSHVNNA